MDNQRLAIGALMLVGDYNWRRRSKRKALAAFLLGRWTFFRDGKVSAVISWWREEPYLIWIGGTLP